MRWGPLGLLALAGLALGGSAPAVRAEDAAAWPALSSGALQDNSFLVEEAYNQEAGVVQHILTFLHDRDSKDWVGSFTQEWPVPDERHQLSFTIPFALGGGEEGTRGVGDVLLNYRYRLLAEREWWPTMAPRLSLLLPTGSVRDGLGSGSTGVQALLPMSRQLAPQWAAHANLGATFLPHALAEGGRNERLLSWTAAGSVIWEPFDAVNFLGELVYARDAEIAGHGVAHRDRLTFSPGTRIAWNGPGGVQWVVGAALPIGLTRAADDLGVFLYLSIEHGVTKAARAERIW